MSNIELLKAQIESVFNNYKELSVNQTLTSTKTIDLFAKSEISRGMLSEALENFAKKKFDAVFQAISSFTEMFPDAGVLYYLQGASHAEKGDLENAKKSYEKAIARQIDYIPAYLGLGTILRKQNNFEAAIEAYEKALEIDQEIPEIYNDLGITLKNSGNFERAVLAYLKAIQLNPSFAAAYNNLGIVLKALNVLDEAIQSFEIAIKLKPNFLQVYVNLGNAQKAKGNFRNAVLYYDVALKISPTRADIHNYKGNTLKELGDNNGAISSYLNAISLQPAYEDAYVNLGFCLRGISFAKPNRDLQKIISKMLNYGNFVRPVDVTPAALSLLRNEPVISDILELDWNDNNSDFIFEILEHLSEYQLFFDLLQFSIITDIQFERFLRNLRKFFVEHVDVLLSNTSLNRLQSALALQCFNNEYIYTCTTEEERIVNQLNSEIEKILNCGSQPSPNLVLGVASYEPLFNYRWHKLLKDNEQLEKVYCAQILEPSEENKLKKNISSLRSVENSTSKQVQQQYEESPYPRWIKLGLPLKPLPMAKIFDIKKIRFDELPLKGNERLEILIAGAGTGQHPLGTAARFENARVTAIDLSSSSLAYAKRKADELCIDNVNFIQADILDLPSLEQRFDIIESAGVLHHMADPLAGWKALNSCLKDKGFMKIGLYSESARSHIVQLRQEISQLNLTPSLDDMKSFRDQIIKSDTRAHKQIKLSSDFYSTSSFRDLLFHVQEHRFTIPQIDKLLTHLNLRFCGFESENLVRDFMKNHASSDALYSLKNWHNYETQNPLAFVGMYQFWCQRF